MKILVTVVSQLGSSVASIAKVINYLKVALASCIIRHTLNSNPLPLVYLRNLQSFVTRKPKNG